MIVIHTDTLATLAEHLRDDEIHVWQLDYDRASARGPLLEMLACYLGIHWREVELIEGSHGRPALRGEHSSQLDFNWSHSGSHAIVALARHIAPGVDVEVRRSRPRSLQIAQRFFSGDEIAALARTPEASRDEAFLRLWTAKEAILKALGRGLAFGLDRLSVAAREQQLSLQRLDGENVADWQLHALPCSTELIAAIAWRGEQRTIRLGRLASDL